MEIIEGILQNSPGQVALFDVVAGLIGHSPFTKRGPSLPMIPDGTNPHFLRTR